MDLRASLQKQSDVPLILAKHVFVSKFKADDDESNNPNMVFSPLSIQIVLGLIAAGSSGSTLDQLLSFLKCNSVEELNSVYSRIIADVLADGSPMGGPRLSVANGAWIEQSLSVKQNRLWTMFIRLLRLLLIFGTRARISDLSACICFSQIPSDGLSVLVPGLLDQHITFQKVKVRKFLIPKFKITFGIKAFGVLKGFGLTLPFKGGLTEMVGDNYPLAIAKVFHKSFIEVNEEGTEAAAVTVATMMFGASMMTVKEEEIDFIADHPFLFLVKDESTGAVLFMETLLNPLVV